MKERRVARYLGPNDFLVHVAGSEIPAIIEADDMPLVVGRSFHIRDGRYASTNTKVSMGEERGKIIDLQHLVMGASPHAGDERVVFINGDSLDCRRANLAWVSDFIKSGMERVSKNNTSGFKGVQWDEREKRWVAMVHVNYKRIYLGRFKDKLDAAKAYDEGLVKYKGPLARTNKSMGLY